MKILFCFIGAYVGYIIGDWSNAEATGVGLGFFIGWIAGALIQQQKALKKVEAQLKLIQSNLIDSRVDVEPSSEVRKETDAEEIPEPEKLDKDVAAADVTYAQTVSEDKDIKAQDIEAEDSKLQVSKPQDDKPLQEDAWQAPPAMPRTPDIADKAISWIKDFFTKGNVVVKIGVIVLFFGVSFLLKYAAGKHVIPVEFWFIAVAIGSIALLVFGWRLRIKNAAYALVIQGGAVGILYITVLSAAKFFT